MSSGKVVQVIGAVIDVEFPRDSVPQVYDALMVGEKGLTLEVQQQLGDGVVRAIAMGPSEGVSRGLSVDEHRRADLDSGGHRNAGPDHGCTGQSY